MPRLTCAAIILSVAALMGCGGNEAALSENTSEAAKAELESTLNQVMDEQQGAAALCGVLSPRQLRESFGARGTPSQLCREAAEEPAAGLTAYEVAAIEVDAGCARVEVVDQRGRDTVFFMREVDGRWLVHDIEEPPISDARDPVCGRVRL